MNSSTLEQGRKEGRKEGRKVRIHFAAAIKRTDCENVLGTHEVVSEGAA